MAENMCSSCSNPNASTGFESFPVISQAELGALLYCPLD